MDERTLIDRYFRFAMPGGSDVLLGIGDDAAVLRPPPGCELVVATDTQLEGTHFPSGTPAEAIGHRCLAVNLSDLAAMGAQPLWCTLALSLLEEASLEVVTGVNLPMAMAAATLDPALELEPAAAALVQAGRSAIKGAGLILKDLHSEGA